MSVLKKGAGAGAAHSSQRQALALPARPQYSAGPSESIGTERAHAEGDLGSNNLEGTNIRHSLKRRCSLRT